MNIRITDLLDDYFDDTVNLIPPETLETGNFTPVPEIQPNKTSRLYKPLLAAATLMLVISGAAALGLGFQRGSAPGGALAESGANTFSITDSADTLFAASAYESSHESPSTVPAAFSQTCTQYCQQGNILSAVYELSPVPPEYVSSEVPSLASETDSFTPSSSQLEVLTTDSTAEVFISQSHYIPNTQTLTVLFLITLTASTDTVDCTFAIPAADGAAPTMTSTLSVPIPCPEQDSYVLQNDGLSGGLYTIYDLEPTSSNSPATLGKLTQLEISPNQLHLTVEAPSHDDLWLATGNDDTFIQQYLEDIVSRCILNTTSELESGLIEYELADGTPGTLNYGPDAVFPDTIVNLSADETPTVIEMLYPLDDAAPIPTDILIVHFHENTTEPEPTNSDSTLSGTMTAVLDLPFYLDGEEGILNALTIDLSTRTYTWKKNIPQLEQSLYEVSPDGKFTFGEPDSEFYDLYRSWEDLYWGTFFSKGVAVVFTDGTTAIIGSGEQVDFSEDYFMESYKLPSNESDSYNIDTTNLIPDYVVINGQNYYFQ